MERTLVLLAAGVGSRYGGLKQIQPVGPGGETLMDYSIFDALRAGFTRLVFVIRRDIERPFKEIIGQRYESRVAVDYVFQEMTSLPVGFVVPPQRKKPWGTAHAILMAAEAVQTPFAVINADDLYGAHSFRILFEHLSADAPEYAMVGFVLRNTLSEFGSVARGVCRLGEDGYVANVEELTRIEPSGSGARFTDASGRVQPLTGEEMVSLNMWGFTPSLFDHLRSGFVAFLQEHGQSPTTEFFIPTVVSSLVQAKLTRLKLLPTPDSWFGITYREDLPRVKDGIARLIARGDYPERLWT